MTATGTLVPGGRLTGAALRGMVPLSAYKAQSQAGPNSDLPLIDDDALLLQLRDSAVYRFKCALGYTGNTVNNGDIKVGWSVPSGATMLYTLYGATVNGSTLIATPGDWCTELTITSLNSNSTTPVGCVMTGVIVMSSTPGTMQLQWTQHAATSTVATTVLAGSVLLAWQVQ